MIWKGKLFWYWQIKYHNYKKTLRIMVHIVYILTEISLLLYCLTMFCCLFLSQFFFIFYFVFAMLCFLLLIQFHWQFCVLFSTACYKHTLIQGVQNWPPKLSPKSDRFAAEIRQELYWGRMFVRKNLTAPLQPLNEQNYHPKILKWDGAVEWYIIWKNLQNKIYQNVLNINLFKYWFNSS